MHDEKWCYRNIINNEMLWCGKADLTDFKKVNIPNLTSAIMMMKLYDL